MSVHPRGPGFLEGILCGLSPCAIVYVCAHTYRCTRLEAKGGCPVSFSITLL